MSEINPELKPCPFCGGEAYSETDRFNFFVYCLDFLCAGSRGSSYKDYWKSVEAWNKRSYEE